MSQTTPHIAAVIMVKNEEKRITVTLNSIVGLCQSLIIYDTGSTDTTIELIKSFADKNKIQLQLIEKDLTVEEKIFDFSANRNVLLSYADKFDEVDYLLLLDCNDEVRNKEVLQAEAKKYLNNKDVTAFLVHQQWYSPAITNYWNIRLLKPRSGWVYEDEIHEYITRPTNAVVSVKIDTNFVLYQDRTQDDDKSSKRFQRDKVVLLYKYEKDPLRPRTLYYLAQTCSCLGEYEEAYRYYLERTKVKGFIEEDFHAFLKAGEIAVDHLNKWDEALALFMRALEIYQRAEPLYKIAKYYREKDKFYLSYSFIKLACDCSYPTDTTLFVDAKIYNYHRWHIMGIVAYYVGKYEEGKLATEIALQQGYEKDINESNHKFYMDKLNETKGELIQLTNNPQVETKKEYVQKRIAEYRKKHPTFSEELLIKLINKTWKSNKQGLKKNK